MEVIYVFPMVSVALFLHICPSALEVREVWTPRQEFHGMAPVEMNS